MECYTAMKKNVFDFLYKYEELAKKCYFKKKKKEIIE